MSTTQHYTAIILAGGKSSRMGHDKGLLIHNNISFIAHIIATIKPFVNDILLVSDHGSHDTFNATRIQDIYPNSGPVGGIYTGLTYSKSDHNFVLSCDIPLLNGELIHFLKEQHEKDKQITCLKVEEQVMPLIGVYHKSCAPIFEHALIKKEFKLLNAIESCTTNIVATPEPLQQYTKNINTPQQYKQLDS